jgi:membrane-associated phospholipid phosphatase
MSSVRLWGPLLLVAALSSLDGAARAEPVTRVTPPLPTPIDGLGSDLADAFTGYNLVLYGVAVASSGIMAFGGADHAVQFGVQRNIAVPAYGDFAQYAGYLVPLVLAPSLYLVGLGRDDPTVIGAGSAAIQSLVLAVLTTVVVKVGVGRVYPSQVTVDQPDAAHEFRPFHYFPLPVGPAWPSGHTVATTSVVAALTGYYPDELWIPFVGYPLALAIGFGLVDGDRHWTSDVIAGGLIGQAIGYTTGRAFRRRLSGQDPGADGPGPTLVPLTGAGVTGLAVQGTW